MASVLPQGCIPANPEIAGIGIRASIYAQNFLAVFLAACYLMDNELSHDEVEYMESSSSANLITGCAMIISAFIQAKTIGLSVYHATIILNLSWMNTTFSVISAAFAGLTDWLDRGLENKRKGPRVGYLGIIHLSLMGSFGVWVWREIDKFGDSPECTPYLFMVFFGHDVSVLTKSLRRVYLIVFWITAIPIVNILMVAIVTSIGAMVALLCLVSPLLLLAYILDRCMNRHSAKSHANDVNAVQGIPSTLTKHGLSLREWVAKRAIRVAVPYLCFVAFIDVFFTIDTELVVRRNQQFVQPGESQWTFGQTLAVIVAITPLWEARKCLKQMMSARKYKQAQTKSVSLDYQGSATLTVEPPISGASTIAKGTTTIDPGSEAYKFSADGSVVATVRNRRERNKVEITRENTVEGTRPFIVTVALE